MQLTAGRLVIAREPAHAEAIAEFCAHFGLEYRGASLCAAVGSVMEKLLKPKRAAISEKLRDEMHEAQGHRCAICDGELRCGEDHGDHVDVLRDQVAGQRQRFRLLCATCNYAVCDAGQRREGEILKSHYSLETAIRRLSPQPGVGRWINVEIYGTSIQSDVDARSCTKALSGQFCAPEMSGCRRRPRMHRRWTTSGCAAPPPAASARAWPSCPFKGVGSITVSYTHLTLPTICSV